LSRHDYAAGIIRCHHQQIGSPLRKLNFGQRALLVLAYLRKGETFAELAAGFGIGTATRRARPSWRLAAPGAASGPTWSSTAPAQRVGACASALAKTTVTRPGVSVLRFLL